MSADAMSVAGRSSASAGSRRRRTPVLAFLLAGLGIALACGCATDWAASRREANRQAFRSEAGTLTAELSTLVERDEHALTTMRGVLTMRPHLGAEEFAAWYDQLGAASRQAGGLGISLLRRVAPSDLLRFERARQADPAYAALLGNWRSRPLSARRGPFCLASAAVVHAATTAIEAAALQANWCDPHSWLGMTEGTLLQTATDTGAIIVEPVAIAVLNTTMFETAVYRPGTPLDTVPERRAAVSGWLVASFDMSALVRTALAGRRDLAVTLGYRGPGHPVSVFSGARHTTAGDLTERVSLPAEPTWWAQITAVGGHGGPSPALQGTAIAVGGSLLSILVALLFLQSARSRERALAMVAEKTGELRRLALHDALTGLPNRVLALDRAEHMLARARREQVPISALYIDVDGFKQINDSFGHAVGDRFLEMVADRLRSVVRDSDTAARLAGDEFVVLLEGRTLDAGPELVAERVLEVLREPYDLTDEIGRQVVVNASIGIASGLREDAEQLLADADVALYAAKDGGRNRYAVYESAMHAAAQERVALELDLREALEHGELALVYQPTLDLASGRPTGAEALLRWEHPERGPIGPAEFIPVAERSGVIGEIGRWVLNCACAEAAGWAADGTPLSISVNVSGRQLDSDELIDDVRDALAASGLDPAMLTLEITETTLMRDPAATARRLEALKEMGVRIAIDDFGTGYCSLGYLRRFPVDTLKIDRSFVQCIGERSDARALVRTLIQLGKTLGLEIVGEGIECDLQLEELRREQCDVGQGFLFARPMPASELASFLAARGAGAVTPARS